MAKGQKSSATSGTRKKNARKAAAATATTGSTSNQPPSSPLPATKPPKNTKYTKRELKEARKREKTYIPPVKPAPPQLDPLDTIGLARTLPPELVIVLRSLGKKDVVTRTKALEELSKWVNETAKESSGVAEGDDAGSEKAHIVTEMLPVWLHRLPGLFSHPARRIRLLAASLQTCLIRLPPSRSALVRWAQEQASQDELDSVLGTWMMLAHDVDRGVATVANRALTEFTSSFPNASPLPCLNLTRPIIVALLGFSYRAVLDPAGLHATLNPVAAPVMPPVIHTASGKVVQGKKSGQPLPIKKSGRYVPPPAVEPHSQPSLRSDSPAPSDTAGEESESDRNGRLRASALGAVRWVIENYLSNLFAHESSSVLQFDTALVSTLQPFIQVLSSSYFWSSLHPGPVCPYTSTTEDSDSMEERSKGGLGARTCFGYSQPQVRRAAWALVASIVDPKRGALPLDILRVLSSAVLRSAWVETDTGVRGVLARPLLILLRDYPQAWSIDAERAIHGYQEEDGDPDQESGEGSESESESESEGESEAEDVANADAEEVNNAPGSDPNSQPSKEGQTLASPAFREFLGFLELGCAGNAVEGYQLVLVVVAGIPEAILPRSLASPPVDQLLDALWSPLYARVLPERRAAAAWLRALLECLVFLVRRACEEVEKKAGAPEQPVIETRTLRDSERERARSLLATQFSALGDAISTRTLRVDEVEAASAVAGALGRVSKIGEDLFEVTFDAIAGGLSKENTQSPGLAPTFLRVFGTTFAPDTLAEQRTHAFIREYVSDVLQIVEEALRETEKEKQVEAKVARLVSVIGTFGSALFEDPDFTSRVDALFSIHSSMLLRSSPSAVTSYLKHRSEAGTPDALDKTQLFWTGVLTSTASYASSLPTLLDQAGSVKALLASVLSAAEEGSLPAHLRGASGAMDAQLFKLLGYGVKCQPEAIVEGLLDSLLSVYIYFLSSEGLEAMTQTLSQNIGRYAENALQAAGIPHSGLIDTDNFCAASVGLELKLVGRLMNAGHQITGEKGADLYVGVALLAFIIPSPGDIDDKGMKETEEARMIWSKFIATDGDRAGMEEIRQVVSALLKEQLRRSIVNSRVLARPDHVIRALSRGVPGLPIDVLSDILPSRSELDALLDDLPASAVSPSLALMDWTIPTSISEEENIPDLIVDHDAVHILPLHPYGRAVSALLTYLSLARTEARTHLWALRHVIALGVYTAEYVQVGDERNAVLGGSSDVKPGRDPVALERREIAKGLQQRVHALTTYLLSRIEDGVHVRAVGTLLKSERNNLSVDKGSHAAFVVEVARKSIEGDTVRDALILRTVLQHLFVDAAREDADLWLTLVRQLEKSAPQTAIVILACITAYAPEPPRLDRYRNELAAALLGVSPTDSDTTGLKYLRLLCASAPDPDSDVVFLPQHRAVNVMRACQVWIAEGDEDVDEDLASMMTLVFRHLAPILQDVSGSHWDFIWDVVENNLETCSLEESDTLATLGRTLQLVVTIESLVATNRSLREGWENRRKAILSLIRNIVAVDTREMPYSDPRALCRELAISIVQDMSSSMMDEKTLTTFLHLITDHSSDVQKMSYHLLQRAAHKLTEHFVIEAGVDTEDVVKAELPAELLALLRQSLGDFDLDDISNSRNQEVSGYLLTWMIVFDLFVDASLKVRSSYVNHIKSLDIISQYFIPTIFDILGLFTGGKNTFKLDMWAVDDFYFDTYEPANSLCIRLLAAHLYHRALLTVPALIRSWISDCTDKQLLTRVIDYTSSYLSPGIVRAELALIRQPRPDSELLTTENLVIKVSSALNEVAASYTVDEQVLELSIRMPNDWPLHRFEVRDTKMVGVSENRWRAWVLGVQQIVWQQNSRIVDALTLFAKNVSLHFAGQVECAICYSIISVMDASLPQKPCRTCKNRFHASCLYKWFKTSHSSSCPLCRSNFN